jgi:hypothetical protein
MLTCPRPNTTAYAVQNRYTLQAIVEGHRRRGTGFECAYRNAPSGRSLGTLILGCLSGRFDLRFGSSAVRYGKYQ